MGCQQKIQIPVVVWIRSWLEGDLGLDFRINFMFELSAQRFLPVLQLCAPPDGFGGGLSKARTGEG